MSAFGNNPVCETLREVLSLQGTDVHVAKLAVDNSCPSSDDGTEGDVERGVAEDVAKDQHTNAALSDALALLGVFPTGLERGYCVIPRQVADGGPCTKRRVVKVVMEEAQVGSCVLAVWDARRKRLRHAGPNTQPPKHEDHNLMYWPATIKRFTGEFTGLSDAPDDLLTAFADFETMEDFSSTLPFLLCVDLVFSDESEEKRQRLDWSSSHDLHRQDVDATPPRRAGPQTTIGSPTSSRRDGACQLLSHLLPQVVSVRNYSIVVRTEVVGGGNNKRGRPSAIPVEHPMVSAPISARDIVLKRAYKSRHFTLLTVSDAAVKAEAKRQALRDLHHRWIRARAGQPMVQHTVSLEEAASQSHRVEHRIPTNTGPIASIGEGTTIPRRRGINGAPTPEQPSLPTLGRLVAEPRSSVALQQQAAQSRTSFLDLDGIEAPGSSRRHHQSHETNETPLRPSSNSPEPATSSTNVSPSRGARLPNRPHRQVAEGLAMPRLQGAACVNAVPSASKHTMDTQPSLRRALPESGSTQQPPSAEPSTTGLPPQRATVPHLSEETNDTAADDEDAQVELAVERLEEELAFLRHRMLAKAAPRQYALDDRRASSPSRHLDDLDKSSPIPIPRSNVPVPLEAPSEAQQLRHSSAVKPTRGGNNAQSPPLQTESRGGNASSVKLWKRAPSALFPPNSYVFVDPNARSISPLQGTAPTQDANRRDDTHPAGSPQKRNVRNAQPSPKRSAASTGHGTPRSRGGAQPSATLLSRPRTAIGIDAHYHRSVAYKDVVQRAVEDSRKHGLDWVRKQQVHHSQLFRRDTKELDSSPVLQRKRAVIEKAERDGSRSPGSRGTSRTPSVTSHGQLSPIRIGSPTQQDVFSRLSTISSSRKPTADAHRGPPSRGVSPRTLETKYAPPPPMETISRRNGGTGGGIIAAVSSTAAGHFGGSSARQTRRSISPDFDVSAPLEPTPHFDASRSLSQHSVPRRSFAMPTLASMAVQS